MSNPQVLEELQRGYRIPQPPEVPKQLSRMWEIQMKCWKSKPEERPTFEWLFLFYDDFKVSSESYYVQD